jgi:hypothetical protein
VKKARKRLISKIFIWWVFCLNIFSIGWLSKYVGTFIKKSKYVYSLPQRLSRYRNSNLHRHGKKNVCGKFLFFSGFSDMPWFLHLSLIIHEVVKENVISEKPLKKRNFPHTFFLRFFYSQLERGPNFPRGGPGMLELCNLFWKLRSKKVWKVFWTPPLSQFLERFSQKTSPQPPPLPTPLHFTENFLHTIKSFEGAPKGRGPDFWSSASTHHPTRYRLARPGSNTLFVTGIFQNADKELRHLLSLII